MVTANRENQYRERIVLKILIESEYFLCFILHTLSGYPIYVNKLITQYILFGIIEELEHGKDLLFSNT